MPDHLQFYPPKHQGKIDFTDIPWPKPGRKLFIAPNYQTPKQGRILIDWVEKSKSTESVGTAFKDAGDQLVEAILHGADGGRPDRFVYPALYLYRHGAELKTKYLINLALRLEHLEESDNLNKILSGHKLYPLWNQLKIALEKEESKDKVIVSVVEAIINDLHKIDPDGQSLRYAFNSNGNKIALKLPDTFDLVNFRSVFEDFWHFLQGVELMYSHYLEFIHEMEREYRSEY